MGGCHYETIGIYIEGKDKGIQTVFDKNDPFMIAYHSWRTLDQIRSDLNIIIRKIQLYQTDIISQVTGDVNEYLSSDPIFANFKRQLSEAQNLFRESQDLQDKALDGSDMETLTQLLENKEKLNAMQVEISRDIG